MHPFIRRLVILGGLAPVMGAFATAPALAQEPLFLRIRPAGENTLGLGGAGPSDEDVARAARARSEAVWQRAEARSRIAIASVCTGCLAASRRAEPGPATTLPPRPEARDMTPVAAEIPSATLPPLAQAVDP